MPAMAVPSPTDTVTDVAVGSAAPFRAPVTVTAVPPAPSDIESGLAESATLVGTVSLSRIVSVAESTLSPVVLPLTVEASRRPRPHRRRSASR